MRLLIGFDADIPDAVAEGLLRGAGVQVPLADVPLALALVVIQPFRDQVRDLLLSPEHEPVPFDQTTLLTTDRSAIRVALTVSCSRLSASCSWYSGTSSAGGVSRNCWLSAISCNRWCSWYCRSSSSLSRSS